MKPAAKGALGPAMLPMMIGAGASLLGGALGRTLGGIFDSSTINIEIESSEVRETVSLKLRGMRLTVRPPKPDQPAPARKETTS